MPKSTTSASSDLTPEQRRQQLAAILARGVLRVLRQAGCRPDEKSPESAAQGLELPGETRLSVARCSGG